MAENKFEDFDNSDVYERSRERALKDYTRNFVVEFGKEKVGIAFDLESEDVKTLLSSAKKTDRPVRWINIWGPNKQKDIVESLATQYKFSPRLLAVMITPPPPPSEPQVDTKHDRRIRIKPPSKDDVELAESSIDVSKVDPSPPRTSDRASHYGIAKSMVHYQSFDVGAHFLCIGANWMYKPGEEEDSSIAEEGKRRPLWCWLVLCDNNTVISIHEDIGTGVGDEYLKSLRHNTISVMSQLSKYGRLSVDPISMQSVRQTLEIDNSRTDPGIEGSSNLFYYLFDDWGAVYATMASFRDRLKELQDEIFEDMTRKSNKAPNIKIIPRLHVLSRRIRQMQHLYEGYQNLTGKILDPKSTSVQRSPSAIPQSPSASSLDLMSRGVVLAQSAHSKFDRLNSRIQFLILSEITEFLAESEALINTYFNINAQKDSESSARLTRSATLLAKLSVLFLPVSFMTSYFSVQIPDLNHYTGKDYWSAFAVIMSLSFLALFFFSRLLMSITETMDSWVKYISKSFTGLFGRRLSRLRNRPQV